jgi:hypothetical protein
MKTADELKQELATLESQQTRQPAQPQAAPVDDLMTRVWKAIGSPNSISEEEREQLSRELSADISRLERQCKGW